MAQINIKVSTLKETMVLCEFNYWQFLKKYFLQKASPKLLISIEKKIRKILVFLNIELSFWKSVFVHFCLKKLIGVSSFKHLLLFSSSRGTWKKSKQIFKILNSTNPNRSALKSCQQLNSQSTVVSFIYFWPKIRLYRTHTYTFLGEK